MNYESLETRRSFLQKAGLALGALSLAGPFLKRAYAAAKKKLLAETDPMATALGYKADAAKVDTKKYPQFKPGSSCATCQLYTKVDETSGDCQMFPANSVTNGGWCMSYSKKAA
ncbi:MAG: high-potential iron-sulfur protein [Bdellovibrionota bacterium]